MKKAKTGKRAAGATTGRGTKRSRAQASKRPKPRTAKPKKAKAETTAKPRAATPRATAARTPSRPAIPKTALAAHVTTELRRRGDASSDPEVVRTIATVGAGYRMGPAADPPWPTALDPDEPVAEGLVDLYWLGGRHPDPDRRIERRTAGKWVDFNLAQYGLDAVSPEGRAALASLALGAWRPGLDEKVRVKILVDFVVRWYRDGLT